MNMADQERIATLHRDRVAEGRFDPVEQLAAELAREGLFVSLARTRSGWTCRITSDVPHLQHHSPPPGTGATQFDAINDALRNWPR